jgi:hypothetical protein
MNKYTSELRADELGTNQHFKWEFDGFCLFPTSSGKKILADIWEPPTIIANRLTYCNIITISCYQVHLQRISAQMTVLINTVPTG